MILDTPEQIKRFQLMTQRRAVHLEKLGLKHSSGNVTPQLKKHYKLPRTATYDQVIEKLTEEISHYATT